MRGLILGSLLTVQASLMVALGLYLVYRFIRNSVAAGRFMRRALGALGVLFVSLAMQNTVRAFYWFGSVEVNALTTWLFVGLVGLTTIASVVFVGVFVYDVDNPRTTEPS